MANTIDWEYIFPAVNIPFKSGSEFQIKAIMDNAFKARPQSLGEDLTPAA